MAIIRMSPGVIRSWACRSLRPNGSGCDCLLTPTAVLLLEVTWGEAMNNPTPAKPAGPTEPKLSVKDILAQFWADAYGKEVQTAATYSYTWLADQFGHLCIGILVNFAATAVGGLLMVWWGWGAKVAF